MVLGPVVRTLSGVEPLDDLPAADLGADAIRRIVQHPRDFGLAPLLDESLPPGRTWCLRLLRTKYKPQRKLTACYTATSQGRIPDECHLAVSWQTARTGVSPEPADTPHGWRVTVLVYPADPCLPALARLSCGAHVTALALTMRGGAVGDTAPLRVQVLRYRPGQRHVLRAVDPADGRALIVKTDKDDSGSRAVPFAQVVGSALERRCPWAGLARPLGYSVLDRASLWHESSGEPLWRVLPATGPPAAQVERDGSARRMLHDTDLGAATYADGGSHALPRCRDADEQVALTLRAGEHISALLPAVGKTYHELVGQLAERLDRLPVGPSALVHGDLKCDHVLVHRDRLRLIDLDRAGRGEPALDLGALMADLRWWFPDQASGFAVTLRDGYGPCEAARLARAETLESLIQLRHVARRYAVHDPEWEPKVRAGVAAVLGAVRERAPR